MDTKIQVYYYLTQDDRAPFIEWQEALRDKKALAAIDVRLDRLSLGNMGDCKALGDNLYELRIFTGPGYRVYFGKDEDTVVILLTGGDKSSQNRDIKKAKEFWQDYRSRDDNDKSKTIR